MNSNKLVRMVHLDTKKNLMISRNEISHLPGDRLQDPKPISLPGTAGSSFETSGEREKFNSRPIQAVTPSLVSLNSGAWTNA